MSTDAVHSNPEGPPRLPEGLYALCDDGLLPDIPLPTQVQWCLDGGVRVVQLRIKRLSTREALRQCEAAARLCQAVRAVCLINDRVDFAMLVGASGVHLGEEDLPVEAARALLGPEALIGATVRGEADIQRALALGASYVGLGPVFPTATKRVDAPVLGLRRLAEICATSPLPVVAIAGIGPSNIEEVAAAGAHAAAVGSALLHSVDVSERARGLIASFDRGRASRSIRGP